MPREWFDPVWWKNKRWIKAKTDTMKGRRKCEVNNGVKSYVNYGETVLSAVPF